MPKATKTKKVQEKEDGLFYGMDAAQRADLLLQLRDKGVKFVRNDQIVQAVKDMPEEGLPGSPCAEKADKMFTLYHRGLITGSELVKEVKRLMKKSSYKPAHFVTNLYDLGLIDQKGLQTMLGL